MHRNKNQSRGARVALALSVAVLVFTASAKPAHAILGVGDISITAGDIPRMLFQIFDRIRSAAGSRAYHQALRSVTQRLAQDTAVWLASGDKGKKPLVFRQPLGDALTEIGDQIAGKFLVNVSQGLPINLCSPASVQSRLKLVVGVSKSIQDIDLFPDRQCPPGQVPAARGCVSADLGQTGCSLSDIGSNFSQAIGNQGQALKNLSKGFDIDRNELGAFLVLREHVQKEKQKQIEQEKSERAGEAGAKAVKDTVTGQVKTPAGTVEEVQKSTLQQNLKQEVQITGDILADAVAIFANTLARTYLRRLQQGLLRGSTASRGPGGLGSTAAVSPAGKRSLLAEYGEFSPTRSLDISSGSLNLIADMTICPSSEDPNVYQSPYHCLLSTDFKQAVEQKLTVRQAVEQGLIPADTQFPQEPVANQPNFSKENLKRLRFLRVIPLGWELAAERLGSQRVSFRTLLDCFEDTNDPANRTLPKNCPRTAPGGAGENLLYHLVDPAWVLALPQTECRALAYGSLPEYSGSPTRQSTCVDLASCISEDANGNCSGYGYCTRERVTWQLSGSSCEPQYATCQTFTQPRELSVLTAYVDNAGCSAQTAGCKWYSTQSTGADAWNQDQKIYLNNNAQSCSASQAQSREVIPLVPGVNYIKNPGFDEELFAGNPMPAEGGWSFGGGQALEQAYIAGTGAIAPIDAAQTTTIKPFTYYTLSFFAYPGPDPVNPDVSGSVSIKTADSSKTLANISFENEGYNTSLVSDRLELTIPDISQHTTSRFAASFYNTASLAKLIELHLTGGLLYDNIQLEEVTLAQGANAIATVRTTADEQKTPADLNTVPGSGQINVASPTTAYKEYGSKNKSVFTNAGECDAAEETSARKYTPAAGGSAVYARLSARGLCSAQCNGFDTLLSMSTPIEKLADPNRRAEQVRFIPDLAQSCTLEQVGCEVFTNVATEGREYYNRIESCVLDANTYTATFFTWEAGQLKVWQLLADRNSSGPCTSFPQGGRAGDVDPATASCRDATGGSPTCSQGEQGALCRTFLDENGVEHKRDANKVVTASDQCTQFRRTAEVSGVQESWYFVPSEANRCSAQAVGCREYKGASANVVQNIFMEPFEGTIDTYQASGQWDIPGIALSDDTVANQGTSVQFNTHLQMNQALATAAGPHNFTNNTYELRFVAKALSGAVRITGAHLTIAGNKDEWFFRGQGSPNAVNGDPAAIVTTQEWRDYVLGPLFWPRTDQPAFLRVTIDGGPLLLDDLELIKVRDTYYRIQNSTLPQREGGNQPNACYDADIRSCKQYRDDKNNTYYVSRFDKLFASELSLTCTAVIDTQNSDSPYSQAFEVGEKERPSGPPVPDWYAVPADQISYRYIDPANKVADSAAGCTALGAPPVGTPATGQTVSNWTTAHKRIDPDEFLGANGTLCNQQGLWCEAFTAAKGGTYYFRDPGDKLCAWNPEALGTEFGGFVDANSNLCDIGEGYVPQCPSEADSCTAYQPTSNELSEAGATTLFRLANQVTTGDCSGEENTALGCVEFKKAFYTTSAPSPQYSPDTVPRSKFASGEPQEAVYEVSQSRQCAEWLAPTTTSTAEEPTTKLSRAITYDLGRCQKMVNNTCSTWVTPSNSNYPAAYKSGNDAAVFQLTGYQNRYTIDVDGVPTQKTIYSGAWDYSGYSLPDQYPVELLREAQQNGQTVLSYGATTPAADALECRGYPEQDSPFDGTGKVVFPTDGSGNFLYSGGITYNDQRFKNFNVCWEDGGACACTYKKVEALDQTVYLSRNSTANLPESTRQITPYDGWYGYCLERASGIKDPRDKEACLAWWPVDVVQGKPNIFENHPEAGYSPGQPMYYCLAARGNKLPQVASDKVSFRDNNYVLDFGDDWRDYFVRGANKEILVRYDSNGDPYAWPDASEMVKSQVIFNDSNNPFANLYEYDIESIHLTAQGNEKTWPKGIDFVLDRDGVAKGSVGQTIISDRETKDRWTALWCGGDSNNKCDTVFENDYGWDEFKPFIEISYNCTAKDDGDLETKILDYDKDNKGNTNLFAVRAVFADENGKGPPESEFKNIVDAKPYQFLGFEGGLCDNSGGSAYVQFKVALQLREWCSDVALVSGAGGENKAWTGRLNNMSQQSSGLCQGGVNNNNLCFSDSNCSGGDSCNYKFDMLRDGSGKIIGGNLTGLYNVMSGEFPVPFPFNISQDNKPFGAIVPPSQKIYVPEEWDSRMNPDDPAASEKTDEEKRALEAGRQPLYVEKANKQVRAGSPYACSASASQCLFPPSKDGKIPTSWVPDQALQTLKYPLEFLNQIFAKVYKIWRWSSSSAGFGYKLIAGGTEPNPSTITNIEGQCPVVLAAEKNTSTNQLDAKQRLILDSQGDIQASDYYNVPRTGACNDGRYGVNGIPIPGTVLSPMVTANVGEEVALQFYGFNYNGEQMPLKEIAIDWGAGETETVITGSFKNHRYDCKEGANYGQTSKACENSPFVFQHIYGQPGLKSPTVTIKDNWGRTTTAKYVDSNNDNIPVIDVIQINSNIDANPDISVPSGLRKPDPITFNWEILGRDIDSITKYKIKVNVKDINGNTSPIASIDQTGTSYTISDPAVLNDLALATISVQPCKASGECGRVASKTFGYPPGEVINISFSPSVPVVGDSVEFVWDRVPEAQEYQLTFISSTLTNETATTSASRYVFPYPTGLRIVRAKIEAHNSSGYGQFGLSDFVEYVPPAPTGLSFTPQNPEFGDPVQVSWDEVGIADSYTYQLSINGGPWANDKTIIAPITTDTIAYIPGTTSLEIQVNAVSGTTDSAWSSPVTITYINPCGNGRVDSGEQCDPAMSSIANYTITPGKNNTTKRCVPAGETKVIGSVTRTQCQWWPDEDNDGHDGELDCQNQTREANMYIGSSYQGLTRVDYNCNNNIDTAMGVCTGTGGGVARSTACPGASQSQADSWCKQYYSRSDATAVGLGGSFYCNTLDEIQCSWCSGRQDKYY